MTECVLPQPVMLTMSPTSSSTITPSHNVFARRSSIRRGTVASISKDIRVNDFVEIIKRQKAIQQKERAALIEAENSASLLKRRHSMMTMSNKKLPLPPSTTNYNKTLRSRTRTMSNNDLNASHFNSTTNVSQQKQRESKVPSPHTHKQQQQQMNATDRIRLEATAAANNNNNTLYHHHLRKCSACCPQKEDEDNEDMVPVEYSSSNSDLSTEEEEEGGCHLSPSTSTSSSSLQRRPFLNPKDTESTQFLPWQQRNATEVNVIKDIEIISNQIKELLDIKSYYSEELQQTDYKHKIQECKALVAQQQKLLDQLGESIESTSTKPPPSPSSPTQTTSTTNTATTNKQKKSTLAICQEVYKSWTLPKSATTQVTIKQKSDKKESDTIISIQGVCTTIESSLIPGKVKSKF